MNLPKRDNERAFCCANKMATTTLKYQQGALIKWYGERRTVSIPFMSTHILHEQVVLA
jgi:hypothetical protein